LKYFQALCAVVTSHYCVAGGPNNESCKNNSTTPGISMHEFPKPATWSWIGRAQTGAVLYYIISYTLRDASFISAQQQTCEECNKHKQRYIRLNDKYRKAKGVQQKLKST
ncbi:Hypothetical predicted protein, partial [Paramuricea clavata]